MLWEFMEILRKLLLSVIGSFWSSKSPMAVATGSFICFVSPFNVHIHVPTSSRASLVHYVLACSGHLLAGVAGGLVGSFT